MKILASQHNAVCGFFPTVKKEECNILFEGGSVSNGVFVGSFIVKIKRKGTYRFDNGVLIKRI